MQLLASNWRRRGTIVFIGVATVVTSLCAFALPAGVAQWVLVAAIALVAFAPIVVRAARRQFDVFEPVVLASSAYLLLWVARPAYNLSTDYDYFGLDLWSQYPRALLGAFISVCAFQFAYHSPLPQMVAEALPRASVRTTGRTTIVVAGALTFAAIAAVFLNANARGGFNELFTDRTGGVIEVAPFIRESFLVALPAAMLLLALPAAPRRTAVRILAVIPLGVIGVMAIPGGDRRYLLPVFLALTTFLYLRRGTRPHLGLAALLVVVLLVFVVDPLRTVRTGDESYPTAVAKSIAHPLKPFTTLLREGDTAMIDTFAMELAIIGELRVDIPPQASDSLHRLGSPNEAVPFRHGLETLNATVLAPIPRQIWPGKPRKVGTLLIDHVYGTTPEGGCVTQCPAFSFVGEAYADFGFWSVAGLSALFGLGLATGYRYLLRFSDNRLVQAAYAAGLWIAFQPWEAGMSIIFHSFILTVAPILVLAWVSGRGGASEVEAEASPSAGPAAAGFDTVPADRAVDVLEA